LFIHWIYELKELKNKVKNLFTNYFKHNVDEELVLITSDNEMEQSFEIIPKKRKRIEAK
jgi:hypothetical protein